jgi:hypothetical protein
MAIAELDAWSGKDPVHTYLTGSGSFGLSHHKQVTTKSVDSLTTDPYSYFDLRRSPSPRRLPELEVADFSTLDNHVVASDSFLSPLSAFSNQQRYFNASQSSPTDSRASTSMPSMTRSPTDSMGSASSPLNDFMPGKSFSSDRAKASVWSEFIYDDSKLAMNYGDAKIFENLTSQLELHASGLSEIDFGSELRKDPIDVASWISESGACL